MVAVGLTAPMATMILGHSGVAMAQTAIPYKPTKAGGGGALKLLFWQAATLLNPHFAIGTKDQEGSRIFYEPLAGWDSEGNLVAILAAELPTKENGGLAADGKSVTWKLKRGVKWHDGKPFTADDVIASIKYMMDKANNFVVSSQIDFINPDALRKVDDLTVEFTLNRPYGLLANAFADNDMRMRGLADDGSVVGTGPFTLDSFTPGQEARLTRFDDYWGDKPGTTGPAYIGAVICCLFVLGMFFGDNKHKWWMLAASIVGVLLAMGKSLPSLNNFYPFRVRDSLQVYYHKVDSFFAPRRPTNGNIEVYIKK